jgi:hypothetical protein
MEALAGPGVLAAEELPHQQRMVLGEMVVFEREEQPHQLAARVAPVELYQGERGEEAHLGWQPVFQTG